MKKLCSLILCVAILCAVLPLGALPVSAETYSDTCGDDLTWELDTETGVLTISGTGAMNSYGSSSAVPWYNYRSDIKTVNIENGVTSIGSYAFYYCSGLTSITIPNSVTSIGNYAFYGCSSLTSVTIPNSVTSIGDRAFYNCSGLTSITIPNSVTSIGNYAFYGCSNLVITCVIDSYAYTYAKNNGIQVNGTVKNFYSGTCGENLTWELDTATGVLTISGMGGMNYFSSELEVPWYNYRSDIKTVNIENGVTSIGGRAFDGCSSLTSVTIPDSVTWIGDNAFYNCGSLTSITIPESVTSIGNYAFYGCSNFVIICDIDSYAYTYAKNNGIQVNGTVKSNYSGTCGGNLTWELDTETGVLTISGMGEMDDYAYFLYENYCNAPWYGYRSFIKTANIENGVTSIGDYAFYGCSNLTSITIPDSVTSIGRWAVSYCSSLTSITIPDSVTSIGWSAFSGCSSLTSINIPDSVTSIGSSAFSGCGSLTSVTIPNSVTSIGDRAFYNCSSLTSVTIPNSVTSIGSSAFYGCSSLTSITIPDSVTSIGGSAFSGCSYLVITCDVGSCAYTYAINEGIPVRYYGGACGDDLTWELDTETGVLTISGRGGMNYFSSELEVPWYNYRSDIKTVNIENGVTSIGGSAFYGCSSLTSITIPDSVTSIGSESFSYCSSLTSITIPESVTSIDDSAFVGCPVTIYGQAGSTAERYALANRYNFVAIPEKIKIFSKPDKLVYDIGEELDLEGLIVAAYLANHRLEWYYGDFCEIPYDFSTPGTKTVTINYLGATATFTVTVAEGASIPVPTTDDMVRLMRALLGDTATAVTADYNTDGVVDVRDLVCAKKLIANS